MGYLGIDRQAARNLAATLRLTAGKVDEVLHHVVLARTVADLAVPVDGMLHQIYADCRQSAAQIDRSLSLLDGYMLALPWWDPTALSASAHRWPRWNAASNVPWNHVQQDSSHNTYAVSGGVAELYRAGVRSFELDIHRGVATDFGPLSTRPWSVAIDHVTHGGGSEEDWQVYHSSVDPDSEYDTLRDGLSAVAALPEDDPLTLFIDVKDDFGGPHTSEQLDELLVEAFDDRLYLPADHARRSAWPTVGELTGRVIVVLTGSVARYDSEHPAAFVASPPAFVEIDGVTHHVPEPGRVFYNMHERFLSRAELDALVATGSIVRTYGHRDCGADERPHSHYRASDISPNTPHC